ncbi:MAG: hypothetical protein LBD30_07980 [Verrucomicrobiales bacterium]|jgi:hypothetical protein|nr:hypothetical protein [Verrucomicrobiales bacterium]
MNNLPPILTVLDAKAEACFTDRDNALTVVLRVTVHGGRQFYLQFDRNLALMVSGDLEAAYQQSNGAKQ